VTAGMIGLFLKMDEWYPNHNHRKNYITTHLAINISCSHMYIYCTNQQCIQYADCRQIKKTMKQNV